MSMQPAPDKHPGPSRVRRIALGLVTALVVGAAGGAMLGACATLPDGWHAVSEARRAAHQSGEAALRQSRAIVAKFGKDEGARDFLARHLAVEESVAGRPLVAGNTVTLLEDGPQTYTAMLEAIRGARDSINLESYILEEDGVARKFTDALVAKRRQGVVVNVITDGVGALSTSEEFFDELRGEGIGILVYKPVNPLKARAGWSLNERDHRKILVVDGRIAFTGGINVSGVYSSRPGSSGGSSGSAGSRRGGSGPVTTDSPKDAKKVPWRDTHVRITGPVVGEFQKLFLDTWARENGPALPKADYYPKLARTGNHLVRAVASGAPGDDNAIYLTYLSALVAAQKSIAITMGYFVPDPDTIDALKSAAERGVDVRLVLPGFSDFWVVFEAGRAHYDGLLEAGVKIYERRDALLHAKTATIDGVWSTVGSSNLDWRSFLHNLEANAVIIGPEFARQMEAMFERDVANAVPIDLASWRKRGVMPRVKETFARLWSYWL
jgi:cardiolipin synthase A/B